MDDDRLNGRDELNQEHPAGASGSPSLLARQNLFAGRPADAWRHPAASPWLEWNEGSANGTAWSSSPQLALVLWLH